MDFSVLRNKNRIIWSQDQINYIINDYSSNSQNNLSQSITEIGTLSLQYPLPSDWHNLVYSSFACAHKAIINKQFYACET